MDGMYAGIYMCIYRTRTCGGDRRHVGDQMMAGAAMCDAEWQRRMGVTVCLNMSVYTCDGHMSRGRRLFVWQYSVYTVAGYRWMGIRSCGERCFSVYTGGVYRNNGRRRKTAVMVCLYMTVYTGCRNRGCGRLTLYVVFPYIQKQHTGAIVRGGNGNGSE